MPTRATQGVPAPVRRVVVLLGLAVLVVALAAALVPGATLGVLYLLPAALLALPMLAGRYVGEERLARAARSWRARRRTPVCRRSSRASALRAVVVLVRGGRLVGSGLAVRPPPVLRAT